MKTSAGVALALKHGMEVTFAAKSPHMIRVYVKDFSKSPILTNSKAMTLSEVEVSGLMIVHMVQQIQKERKSS